MPFVKCKKCKNKFRTTVPVFVTDGVKHLSFDSMADAADHFGITRERIRQCTENQYSLIEGRYTVSLVPEKAKRQECKNCEKERKKKELAVKLTLCTKPGCNEKRVSYSSVCRLHFNERCRAAYIKNRQKRVNTAREWQRKNKDRCREYSRSYYKKMLEVGPEFYVCEVEGCENERLPKSKHCKKHHWKTVLKKRETENGKTARVD